MNLREIAKMNKINDGTRTLYESMLAPELIQATTDWIAAVPSGHGIAEAIFNNAVFKEGIKIASPSGLVVSKLNRFKLQDQADIEQLYQHYSIDLSPYPIPQTWLDKYNRLVASFGEQ